MLPTRFGGGSNMLTSLVSIVAKYRGWARSLSSSSFPETSVSVYPMMGLGEPLSFALPSFERWLEANSPAFALKALSFSMTSKGVDDACDTSVLQCHLAIEPNLGLMP